MGLDGGQEVVAGTQGKAHGGPVVVAVHDDVVVVVGRDDVRGDGPDADGVGGVVLARGLVVAVEVPVELGVLLEEAGVGVAAGDAAGVVHYDGVAVGAGGLVVHVLVVVVEGEPDGRVGGLVLLVHLSPPFDFGGLDSSKT